jgi:hypothetical protein
MLRTRTCSRDMATLDTLASNRQARCVARRPNTNQGGEKDSRPLGLRMGW